MGVLNLVFILVAVPVFFFMITWAAVTTYRLLFPEKPLPLERHPVLVREKAAGRRTVSVGVRQIKEDQRYFRTAHARAHYDYFLGYSEGVPEVWVEDLWQRRN